MLHPKTILCIENNADCSELISLIFQKAGFYVTCTDAPHKGIELAMTNKYVAIIMGHRFAGMNGIDLCRAIRNFDTDTPIIFFTTDTHSEKRQDALKTGAQAYLIKPEGFESLEETVIKLIHQKDQEALQSSNDINSLGFLQSKTYHPRRIH